MHYKTCYSVDTGFFVGPHPAADGTAPDHALIHILQERGVTTIIDLTSPADHLVQPLSVLLAALPHVTIRSFPIPDMGVPSYPLMLAVLDAIDAARNEDRSVYLHCKAGIGRSGMTVACWLIRHGVPASTVLDRLAALRGVLHHTSPSPETASQRAFVQQWIEPSASDAQKIRAFRNRYRGTLLGLAVGDCLGVPLEFTRPGERTVSDLQGGGTFDLTIGEWTDDTSMALCLADSIVSCGVFDAHDQLQRYIRWQNDGLWSSKDFCFDIGITVAQALRRYDPDGTPYVGSTDPHTAGNGSLMRLAPIPMAYGYDDGICATYAAQSSLTTHGAATAVDACQLYAAYIAAAIRGVPRHVFLEAPRTEGMASEIQEIAHGSFRTNSPPAIVGSGYVVRSLEAALWAFAGNDSYATATLAAVNLGEDADTTGAICGMLAGAYWGESGIPEHWLGHLVRKREIEWLAEELLRQSWSQWQRTFAAI